MYQVNYGQERILTDEVRTTIRGMLNTGFDPRIPLVSGDEWYAERVLDLPAPLDLRRKITPFMRYFGVTAAFRDVIDCFHVPEGETPAGFRIEYVLDEEGVLRADLVRDIAYDRNGQKRATQFLFSADSANPYEVAPISAMLANLTCNPGIVYDLFINNPEANVGGAFKTRDEVIEELGRVLGPGVDISVELNNPFEQSFEAILEEAARFREMLSPYRVVIKVPHTGPVNADNVNQLLTGGKRLDKRFDQGATADMLRGHNLALKLREAGYRINFTLMFEPYQTAMALQAKPYFINSFIRHRMFQAGQIKRLLHLYDATEESSYLEDLRSFMLKHDFLAPTDSDMSLLDVRKQAQAVISYRQFDGRGASDGLDGVRYNLRMLRNCNLPETRLIICSMEGPAMYPSIADMMVDPEFQDMMDRLVITATPDYLARFTSCNHVVSYQRRFMNAVQGQQ